MGGFLIGEDQLSPIPPFNTDDRLNGVLAKTTFDTIGHAAQDLVFWVVICMLDGSGKLEMGCRAQPSRPAVAAPGLCGTAPARHGGSAEARAGLYRARHVGRATDLCSLDAWLAFMVQVLTPPTEQAS